MRSKNENSQVSGAGEFIKCLSQDELNEFHPLQSFSQFSKNVRLFEEEEKPTNVLILLEGQVKLYINSSEGKRLILSIAGPGEILGLASVMFGIPYDMTAETLQPCLIVSLPIRGFLCFLMRHPTSYENVARELSLQNRRAYSQLRTIGLVTTAQAKLARLLLQWESTGKETGHGTRLGHSLTHAEIGECIGASRETISRTLGDFKQRELAELDGTILRIRNRAQLEHCACQVLPWNTRPKARHHKLRFV